jgi:hypothetical protein
MPCGDETGPGWTHERNWRCRGAFRQGYHWRRQRVPRTEPITLTKEQQKEILEKELKEIELEQQEIKKRLAELET